jgi:hypothetical protein
MNGQEQTMTGDEPSADDNYMRVDPNDPSFKVTADWEDEKFYLLDGVKVQQTSPGEFRVVSIASGEETEPGDTESPSEDAGETGEEPGEAAPEETGNPAIAAAIKRRYSK